MAYITQPKEVYRLKPGSKWHLSKSTPGGHMTGCNLILWGSEESMPFADIPADKLCQKCFRGLDVRDKAPRPEIPLFPHMGYLSSFIYVHFTVPDAETAVKWAEMMGFKVHNLKIYEPDDVELANCFGYIQHNDRGLHEWNLHIDSQLLFKIIGS